MSGKRTIVEVSCDRFHVVEVGTVIGSGGGGGGGNISFDPITGALRLVTRVAIDDMLFPTPQITRDDLGRIEQLRYDYPSIRVLYDVVWNGDTNVLNTYTQTIEDLP